MHDTVVFVFISRVDAMCKIQTLLRNQQFEEAIGLLRASRYTYLNVIKFIHLKWVGNLMSPLAMPHLKSGSFKNNFHPYCRT